jgi:hypothetical protein
MLCFVLMLKLLSVHKYLFRLCCIDIVFNIDRNIKNKFPVSGGDLQYCEGG